MQRSTLTVRLWRIRRSSLFAVRLFLIPYSTLGVGRSMFDVRFFYSSFNIRRWAFDVGRSSLFLVHPFSTFNLLPAPSADRTKILLPVFGSSRKVKPQLIRPKMSTRRVSASRMITKCRPGLNGGVLITRCCASFIFLSG